MSIIITADQRLAAPAKINIVLVGPIGVGKTTQARTLSEKETLFIDLEAGDLAVQGWSGNMIKVRQVAQTLGRHPWEVARALAVWIGGADPSDTNGAYSGAALDHYNTLFGGSAATLAPQSINFWDSITVAARWCLDWAQKQPESLSEKTGKPDLRGAYGLLGREMVRWLTHIQHSSKSTIITAILDATKDDLNRTTYELQIDGAKTGLALPGIFDEVISLVTLATPEGQPYRAFVCHQDNAWKYPAKDRSGCLNPIEEPHLGKLITKIRAGKRLDTTLTTAMPGASAS